MFHGKRILCDTVAAPEKWIAESCFARDDAMMLFGFPEMVGKCKKTPKKMFRTLDLYEAILDNWPQIESIFSFESTANVHSQVVTSIVKLGVAMRTMLLDFESVIQKESSKMAVHDGGVHPLTCYVMNYISLLANYRGVLTYIITDYPQRMPPECALLQAHDSGGAAWPERGGLQPYPAAIPEKTRPDDGDNRVLNGSPCSRGFFGVLRGGCEETGRSSKKKEGSGGAT